MGTFIVGIIVLTVVIFSLKATIKAKKQGGCACDSYAGHCHDIK